MPRQIKNIRAMMGVGVFADYPPQSAGITFLRNNLIYGFNGSGKSTLSRMFASLQTGTPDKNLPKNCTFEFELSDGTRLSAPGQLRGVEEQVRVFNADFVERNLQWAGGTANPVFYIGRDLAKAAEELARLEADLPQAYFQREVADEDTRTSERAIAVFKRERARLISEQARLRARSYEAPQIEQDFRSLEIDDSKILDESQLYAAITTCRLEEPMLKQSLVNTEPLLSLALMIEARELVGITLGFAMVEELQRHPDMVLWVQQGLAYHNSQRLDTCLFCDNPLGPERRQKLEQSFDRQFETFLSRISMAHDRCKAVISAITRDRGLLRPSDGLVNELRDRYANVCHCLAQWYTLAEQYAVAHAKVLEAKRMTPTKIFEVNHLPDLVTLDRCLVQIRAEAHALNQIITLHNEQISDFQKYRDAARVKIRCHYLALSRDEYNGLLEICRISKEQQEHRAAALISINEQIAQLRAKIREHSAAAEKINKLVLAYLGHDELTILPVADGYEIHRHGNPLRGPPSEGEKTAIAICYFLSTLTAEGKKLKDLIVVVDDPVSSLDARGLNFACAMVRASIGAAMQVFLLTHNLACMNEFKKAWKNAARSDDPKKPATAKFLFMDVKSSRVSASRRTNIVEMSKLLREYDNEYHYLFSHLLKFQISADEYDYAYMMPNVLRRVLDVFLAFKCPGSSGLAEKIQQLCTKYPMLDRSALMAVDRLVQTESHSDNLDDLISFSSMTIEESKRAADAILDMMQFVDPVHRDLLMGLCRTA